MPCQFGKQTTLPFNNSVSHALSSFDLIHSDVWGLISAQKVLF